MTTEECPVYAHLDDNVGYHKVLYASNLIYTAGTEPFVQIKGQQEKTPWQEWRAMGYDKGSIHADPLFRDFNSGDYTLQKYSPAFNLGFEPIPVDQIGCYRHESRMAWPLEPKDLPQEDPVFYQLN